MSANVGEWVRGKGGIRHWRSAPGEGPVAGRELVVPLGREATLNEKAVRAIKARMAARDLTQTDMAERLNLSPDTIRRRLNEDTSISLTEFGSWAAALGTPPLELLGEDVERVHIHLGSLDLGERTVRAELSITIEDDPAWS